MAGIPVQDEFEPMGNYYLIRAKYVDVEGVRLDKVINQVKSSIEAIKTDFYTKAESDSKYASKTDVYTKSEVDTALNGKVSAQSGYGLISDADKAQIQTNKAGIAAAETAIAGKASQEEINTIKSDVAGKASAEAVSQLQTEMDVQKARMDQLVEDPEVGVDEIADARIDNTGKTYANLGDHIRGTETSLKETVATLDETVSGNIILPKMELGDFYVNGSGTGTYYDSNSRIRVVKDTYAHIEKGYSIGLSDYTNLKMVMFIKTSDGKYISFEGWITKGSISCQESGDYVILISTSDGSKIEDADAVVNLLYIKKGSYLTKEIDAEKIKVRTLSNRMTNVDGAEVLDWEYELGDFYINGSGVGTYYNSNSRVRNVKDKFIHFEKGEIIGLFDYESAKFGLRWKENDVWKYIDWSQTDITVPKTADYIVEIVGVPEVDIASADVYGALLAKKVKESKLSDIDYAKSAVEKLNGIIRINLELGDLYVNASGTGTYYDSKKRVRTKANNPIYLEKGTVVGVLNSSQVFAPYLNNLDGTYTRVVGSFLNKEYMIQINGYYEFVIRNDPEETVTNIEDFTSSFYIKGDGLTAYDKINMLNENGFISNKIFSSEINDVINRVREKTTSRAIVFGIMTDTHLDSKREAYFDQTCENMRALSDAIGFDAMIHLGDVVNGYDPKSTTVNYLQYAAKKLMSIRARRCYVVAGNHDNNQGAGDNERLTDVQIYSYLQRFFESDVERPAVSESVYDSIASNFYVDYPSFKIRTIFFSSVYYSEGFADRTIEWVESTMNNAPEGYKFVLFTHESTEDALNGTTTGNAAQMKAMLVRHASDIMCYIHGHSHCDWVGYPNGFAQIAVCCAVPDQPIINVPEGATQPSREIGTVTQDCFDVAVILPDENKVEMIRFGAGNDRTVPFRN